VINGVFLDWTVSADSTIARPHQHAAGARRVLAHDAWVAGVPERGCIE
jgi:hypothetical protein